MHTAGHSRHLNAVWRLNMCQKSGATSAVDGGCGGAVLAACGACGTCAALAASLITGIISSLHQLLMEFQKLVLVVLQILKVDFQRAQSVFACCAYIDNKSGNKKSVNSSSPFATTRCELTLERRRDSNALQNLMNSLLRSATF
jgi:hypothetical protein